MTVGLVVLALALGYRWFWLDHPMGSGPTAPAVPRTAFAGPWTTRRVELVGFGDSITDGFGATPQHSYFDRLVFNPPDETPDMQGISLGSVFPHLHADNRAISGSTSPEHASQQIPKLRAASRDVLGIVVMTTGGNDLIHNYGRTPPREAAMYGATWGQAQPWIAAFQRRLDRMLREIESRFPGGCRISVANIYDPTDGVGDIELAGLPRWRDGLRILDGYNSEIARVISRHRQARLVNVHDAFLGHGIHCRQFWTARYHGDDPHYWYYSNLEDPNDRGYDAIRRLFLTEMARSFGKLP